MADRELREEMALDRLTADMPPDQAHSMRGRIRAKAEEIRESPEEVIQGMQAVRNLTLATGSPAPRVILPLVIDATTATKGRKKVWKKKVMKALPDKGEGLGCIQVDFFDTSTQKPNVVRLVLEPCGGDHDLDAQLAKIYSRIPPQKHAGICKHLGMLIHCGRAAYGDLLASLGPVAHKIKKSLPAGSDIRMVVDPANTTLFVGVPGTKRVGIFIYIGIADQESGSVPD
jgi:hypothetical protein